MKNAFIIIHYNDSESIIHLLDNIKNYNIIDKILIVDNNSRIEEVEKIREYKSKKIDIIENTSNLGFACAINQGAKKVMEELGQCKLIISNCDIEIKSENDLIKLLNDLDNKQIGLLAPVVEENGSLNRGWKNPKPFIDSLMNLPVIHRNIRKKHLLYKDDYYNGEFSKVDVVSGCFFLIRSEVLKRIDYLDENTFLYYEENILAKRVSNINLDVMIDNMVTVKHNHSVSIDKNVNKIRKIKIQRSSGYYFQKEYNHANIFSRIFYKITAFIGRTLLRIVYIFKK